ncbi:hypothetical protein GCM10009745_18750 [Kribbella yunnanensis]|uniref:Uncharacterized protein n=1 Tax=Kribbella yunnanensis TaxID=190194 RepID=A0ABP4SPG7_9ACTN
MKYLDRALCSLRHLEVRCSMLPTDGPYAEAKEYCLSFSANKGGLGEGVAPDPVLRMLPQVLVEERGDVRAESA